MKCETRGCRNKTNGSRHCNKCRSRKWRKTHPIEYAYYNLRNNAKRRGVHFTITIADFRQWCVKVNYIGFKKGRHAESFTVDRIHNDIGYHIDNIQVLTKRDNIVKYFSYDWRTKRAYTYTLPGHETSKEENSF